MLIRKEDLYMLGAKDLVNSNSESVVNQVSSHIWLCRLGHLSYKRLDPIKDILHFCSSSTQEPCCICPLAKQRRLPLNVINNLIDNVLDLIHCHIWSLFHLVSHNGCRFLILVDDYSRYIRVFMVRHKSDVHKTIPNFILMVEIKHLRM